MAVTRINNNQITDAQTGNVYVGVNASSKLQDYTITSAKIANNLVYGSDLTISGNLTVNGQTTTIDTTVTTIEDPVIVLASNQSGTPTVDIGFIGERGSSQNVAFVWDESAGEFVTVYTNDLITNTTVTIASYASFHTNDANIGGNIVINGTTSAVGNINGSGAVLSGNISAGNVLTSGLVSATGNVTSGNVNTTNISLSGNVISALNVTGNIAGANINTGGLISSTGNVTGGNLNTGGQVVATGNVTSGNVNTTNISLSGNVISALNVTGNVTGANINTGGLISSTGNVTGGNLNTAGQVVATGNVTGGNILTAGNVNANQGYFTGNVTVVGTFTSTSNIVANTSGIFYGNAITGVDALYAGLPTFTPLGSPVVAQFSGNANSYVQVNFQNINSGNRASTDYIATADNGDDSNYYADFGINSSTFDDPVDYPGFFPNDAYVHNHGGNLIINPETAGKTIKFMVGGTATSDIIAEMSSTQLSVDGITSVTGNVTGANLITGGLVTAVGNVVGGNITTAGQVVATANITGGNILTAGLMSATGTITSAANITGGNLITSGVTKTGTLETTGNALVGGNLIVQGNITYINIDDLRVEDPIIILGTGPNGAPLTTDDGMDRGVYMEYYKTGLGNAFVGWENSSGNILVATSVNFAANNVVNVLQYGTLQAGNLYIESASVVGNVAGGNLTTAGQVVATANITGGNILTAGLMSATGTITSSANITGANLVTGGLVTATGNVIGGNINTAGQVVATGTITGGNLATAGTASAGGNVTGANLITGGLVTATGNVIGGNINTAGQVVATGNVTSGNVNTTNISLSGNVISALNVTGNIAGANVNTDGLVTAAGNVTGGNLNTAGQVVATGNVTSGNVNTTNISLSGNVISALNVTGNIAGANVNTGGLISATGNVTGGNLNTAGQVVATANITGGNILTAGLMSATGNIDGGNLRTAGLITATGNITGGNLILTSGFIDSSASRITINGSDADVDFAVDGDTVANVFYVDAGTGTASFGSSTQTTNAIVAFNATNSILMPVGTTVQRPGTGTIGMLRFNSTDDNLEIYSAAGWEAVGVPTFTVISDEQFTGDGSTVAFTLGSSQTTASCIVSINGVIQIPTIAYSVTGTTLTFTEAPQPGDLIDVRQITTTTTVTAVSNTPGTGVVAADPTLAQVNVTGNLLPVANNVQNLGNATLRWKDLFLSGNTLTLGNVVMKNVAGGNTIAFYGPDGTTPATIASTSVDTTQIANGTSSMAVVTSNGNIRANVAGSTVALITTSGMQITGDLSVTGNATLSGNILGDRIQNGTTQIDIQTINGNANISVGGVANVAVFSTGGVDIGGNVTLTGNIVDSGALGINTGSNGNITLNPNGTGVIIATKDIVNGQANGVGNIGSATGYFNTVFAKATSAQYADLAEKYVADAEYAPGTVVVFGGSKEVTVSSADGDTKVAGVVSTNPSYIMNGGLEAEHVATVALTGRVPTRVTGTVRKGDLMVSAGYGLARAEANPRVGTVIGKALEDFDGQEGVIEVVVGRF